MYAILHGSDIKNIEQLSDTLYESLEEARKDVKNCVRYMLLVYDYVFVSSLEKNNIMQKVINGTLLKENEVKYYIFENNGHYEIIKFKHEKIETIEVEKITIMEKQEETKYSYFSGYYTETVEVPTEKEIVNKIIEYKISCSPVNNIKIVKINNSSKKQQHEIFIDQPTITEEIVENLTIDNIKEVKPFPEDFTNLLKSKREEIFNKRKIDI